MSLSVSDLEKVVIESFFDDVDFCCGLFKFVMNIFASFAWESSVKFAP